MRGMNDTSHPSGVYGAPPHELAPLAAGTVQYSPLTPGAKALETAQNLAALTILAPPNTRERRCVLAAGLHALVPGGKLTALAPKDKGGARLAKELAAFGCKVDEESRKHHRILRTHRPAEMLGIEQALAEGAMQRTEATGLWAQPGMFSWDRIDPGTALLLAHLPMLAGEGADFGCGAGLLAKAVLASEAVEKLTLIDLDRRAVEASRLNVTDPRAHFLWADIRYALLPRDLDFVVMNPPFHDQGAEDRALGQLFIERAAASLRPGGICWLTANRHLPYEAVLREHFEAVELRAEENGFKIFEARR